MVKETKFFRKQRAKAERMAQAAADPEISQRLLNTGRSCRKDARAKGKRESDSSGTGGGGVEIAVPRARLTTPEGKTAEWKSQALPVYQRRTLVADALIASSYLAGANTRRVRRALAALFAGTVGKDTVSRVWRKVKSDWDVARCHHGFAGCPFAESGKAAGAGPVRGLFMCRSSRAIVPGASAASPDSAGCARFRRNRFLKAAMPARNGSRLINGAWSILPRDRSFCVMTDQYQSHFDGIAARAAASRRDRFVVGLLLGLILGGGLTLLWTINRSAPRATKDLQTTEQKIAGQLQSLQQTLASNQAETKQALASEQAETKRLSDQAALSSKLDALQQSFASAQRQSSPASSEPPPAPAKRRR